MTHETQPLDTHPGEGQYQPQSSTTTIWKRIGAVTTAITVGLVLPTALGILCFFALIQAYSPDPSDLQTFVAITFGLVSFGASGVVCGRIARGLIDAFF